MKIEELCKQIAPPDESARVKAKRRWDACAKPLHSLGLLEDAFSDICALTGRTDPALHPRAVYVFCADHGIVRQGVTQTGSEVTAQVARALARGETAVCRMAEVAGCRVVPVDMGIRDFDGAEGVIDCRIGNGTADFTAGCAMTEAQTEAAVLAGVRFVREEQERGTKLLAAGEMGIGNTTCASAIVSVLLERDPAAVTGRGAGLSDAGLRRKIDVIRRGIDVNRPDRADAFFVLQALGGFEIAAMCGLFLGGALYRIPVLIDGFPCATAALVASRICPQSTCAMIASHVSAEPACGMVLDALRKRALINADMRLGEGTGAVSAMPLLDMARAVCLDSYTFEEGGIEPYTPQ